jgi:uncharacterized membrane protein
VDDFGVTVASPESTLRAAASASSGSDLPALRRSLRSGRSTSTTTTPRSRSQRHSPAPYAPVPSIPTVSIVPSSLAHARQLGEPGGRGRDLELAEAAAELVEGDRQVGVLVGVDTEGDQHLGVWHRCHRTVSSSLMVMTVRRGRAVRTALR